MADPSRGKEIHQSSEKTSNSAADAAVAEQWRFLSETSLAQCPGSIAHVTGSSCGERQELEIRARLQVASKLGKWLTKYVRAVSEINSTNCSSASQAFPIVRKLITAVIKEYGGNS